MRAYAECIRVTDGAWEVFCTDCHKSIGTMTGNDVIRAILATRKRGGIKCPECRGVSCVRCGHLPDGRIKLHRDKICDMCHWEINTGKEQSDKQVFLGVALV